MTGGTFTLSWVINGQRITTDPIPHDADEATTNVAIADATRKDRRDMLQKLTDARGTLSDAEQEVTIARAVEAARFREERDITRALREAHKLACGARVVTMAKAKAARAAKDEVRQIKNVLYGAAYGDRAPTTLGNAKAAQRIAAEKYTAAWAAFNLIARGAEREAGARAIAARAKADHAEATRVVHAIQDAKAEALKDVHGCPRVVSKDDVLAAYDVVNEAVAIAEKANETAIFAEAVAISAFNAHLAAKDKAIKAAAKTYAVTFTASHDIGAADTAAKILFSKVCKSDVRPAWDIRAKANEEAVTARKHANGMRDKATEILEQTRALGTHAREEAEAAQMVIDAHAAAIYAEARWGK